MEQKFVNVLPFIIKNRSSDGSDFLYINKTEEEKNISIKDRKKLATDFCVINAESVLGKNGKYYGWYRLSDNTDDKDSYTHAISPEGKLNIFGNYAVYCGYAPCVNMDISKYSLQSFENNFSKVNSFLAKIKNEKPTIKFGAYPQTYVKKVKADFLESCFNNGKLRDGLKATGRFYTCNGNLLNDDNFIEKKCPEFEIDGQRYVRYHQKNGVFNINGRIIRGENTAWFKVEPVEFVVKNWSKIPSSINPKGTGEDYKFNLQTKNIMFSGISFGYNSYKNSFVRKFINETLLNEMFNPERLSQTSLVIPSDARKIAANAYEGCLTLDKVIIHKNIKSIGEDAFKYCQFNYGLHNKKNGKIILTKEKPKDFNDYDYIVNFSKMFNYLIKSDYETVLNLCVEKKYEKLADFIKIIDKLSSAKLFIPNEFIKRLEETNLLNKFANNDFRFLKNEIPNINEILNVYPDDYRVSFFDFATAFGCFEHKPILDKNGKPTNYLIAQKACSVLAQLLKSKEINIETIHYLLCSSKGLLTYNSSVNQDFIKFLSTKGKDGKYENLQMLLDLEEEDRGSFVNAINRFSSALLMRNQPDMESGIKKLSWKEIFIRLKNQFEFEDVTEDSWPIAKLFTDMNIDDQNMFDLAKSIYERAKISGIKNHILNGPLKEKSIRQSIEDIKNDTENQLELSRDLIEDLYEKGFTYEFLDKYDPRNVVLGTFCSCCAVIGTTLYGSKIAESTVTAPDVQNLVVKDANNNIIAKAAMYVNTSKGYIVFNDFEINQKYRKNEKTPGIYTDYIFSEVSKERDEIFNAFMRGLNDFIKEYDKENPDNPIKFATVGNGYNRLKQQCAKFKMATKCLKVPYEYDFADAMEAQTVLYEREGDNNLNDEAEEEILEWKN